MTSNRSKAFLLCVTLLMMSCTLFGQEDLLIEWHPDDGEQYGPEMAYTGYMAVEESGTCWTSTKVSAEVIEDWTCTSSNPEPTVSGMSEVEYCEDDEGLYPCGVSASGTATINEGVVQESSEDAYAECEGYGSSTGGPTTWPIGCGTGEGTYDALREKPIVDLALLRRLLISRLFRGDARYQEQQYQNQDWLFTGADR